MSISIIDRIKNTKKTFKSISDNIVQEIDERLDDSERKPFLKIIDKNGKLAKEVDFKNNIKNIKEKKVIESEWEVPKVQGPLSIREMRNILIKVILRNNIKLENKRTLEIGSGIGRIYRAIKIFNPLYTGVDISKSYQAKLYSILNDNDNVVLLLSKELPFVDNYFNTIFCISVFFHLKLNELENITKEACRVLKEEGYIICSIVHGSEGIPKHNWQYHNLNDFIKYCEGLGLNLIDTFYIWENNDDFQTGMVFKKESYLNVKNIE